MNFSDRSRPLHHGGVGGGLAQWTTAAGLGAPSTMHATIVLDQPPNHAYTNLDRISGRVVVRSSKSENVNSIVVKLEGESRTRLMTPAGVNGERPRPMIEYHKILYRLQTVFPPSGIAESRITSSGKAAYGLPAGEHHYPFTFKLPFNNNCSDPSVQSSAPIVVGMEIAKPATRHVKKTLPPTMAGFPGEAEIRYFVKCTVNRHSLFKENARAYSPFNFLPIEPPRPPFSGSEIFARQRHTFDIWPGAAPPAEPVKDKVKGMFGGKTTSSVPGSPATSWGAPTVSVDARLPEPAILTCNQDIPLRLLLKKLSSYTDQLYLKSLQISLIGYTKVRAHELYRTESNSWIIMSKSNMGIPIGHPSDPVDTETVIDDAAWRGQTLPNTVAPAFATCNIERSYQLDIRIGLSYGSDDFNKVSFRRVRPVPQQIVLPLRLDTQLYSGIAPPAEVLERMATTTTTTTTTTNPPATPHRPPTHPLHDKLRYEGRPTPAHAADFGSNQVPGSPVGGGAAPEYGDAPPSYEDAIADRAGPVTAPRPTYVPPAPAEDPLLGMGDEKKGWGG